jgi:hypothetical protein
MPHFESIWPEMRSLRPSSSIVGVNATSRVGKLGPMKVLAPYVISPATRMPSPLASLYV